MFGRHALCLLVLTLPVASAVAKDATGSEVLDAMLDRIEIRPGREDGAIAVFPLALRAQKDGAEEEKSSAPPFVLARPGDDLGFREPEWPERRWNVEVRSRAKKPVLLPGGSLLVGGRLDRMIPEDLLLPPGKSVEIETIPAEYRRDVREPDDDAGRKLELSSAIAPGYLRKHAVFDADHDLVPRFVSHFLAFREKDDSRHSLQAIVESPRLRARVEERLRAHAGILGGEDEGVIGWVTVVAGRVHGLELFGWHATAKASFPAFFRALAFPVIALEQRADDVGLRLPQPDPDDSPERLRPAVERFLGMLRHSARRCGDKPEGTLGSSCLLRKARVWGEVTVLDGRLAHAGAVADLPLYERLYRKPFPAPSDEDAPAFGELERTGGRDGGLTEFERRLLERMEGRRGN
jgi:hypothetical protein